MHNNPYSLALIRIATSGVLLGLFIWEDPVGTTQLPVELFGYSGLVGWLAYKNAIFSLLRSPVAVSVLYGVTLFALITSILGYRTRFSLCVSAVGIFLLGGLLRQYTWFFHVGIIPWYVLCVLCFCRSADVWSLDSIAKRTSVHSTIAYASQTWLCWLVIAWLYVMAPLSKLRNGGMGWWDSMNMRAHFFRTNLNPMHINFDGSLYLFEAPDFVFSLLGFCALVVHLLFPFVLFFSLARRILPLCMIAFHLGTLVLQNILFADMLLLLWIFPLHEFLVSRGFVRSSHRSNIWSRGAAFVSVFFLVVLIWGGKYYPFTSMTMFSGRVTEPVVPYVRFVVHQLDGSIIEPSIDRFIPALHDGRYKHQLRDCFRTTPKMCDQFLEYIYQRMENRFAIAKLVVEQWQWNFKEQIPSPYGHKIRVYHWEPDQKKSS